MLQKISSSAFLIGLLLWALTAPTKLPILTMLAVGIHELGHLLAAALMHLRPTGICADTLGIRLLFGSRMLSYREELWLSASGPLFNLLSLPIALFFPDGKESFFFAASCALSMLNLLPIFGFDGGRILSCLLSRLENPSLADRILSITSFLSLFALWSASVYLILRMGSSLSLFLFSTAIFFRIFLQKNAP